MAKINKVLRLEKFGNYGIVYVQMSDGDEEYKVYIGGDCETYHHKGQNKAFIKKPIAKTEKKKAPIN